MKRRLLKLSVAGIALVLTVAALLSSFARFPSNPGKATDTICIGQIQGSYLVRNTSTQGTATFPLNCPQDGNNFYISGLDPRQVVVSPSTSGSTGTYTFTVLSAYPSNVQYSFGSSSYDCWATLTNPGDVLTVQVAVNTTSGYRSRVLTFAHN